MTERSVKNTFFAQWSGVLGTSDWLVSELASDEAGASGADGGKSDEKVADDGDKGELGER